MSLKQIRSRSERKRDPEKTCGALIVAAAPRARLLRTRVLKRSTIDAGRQRVARAEFKDVDVLGAGLAILAPVHGKGRTKGKTLRRIAQAGRQAVLLFVALASLIEAIGQATQKAPIAELQARR